MIAASGTFGFGREYNEFYPLSTLGGISSKGITLKERLGNPPPRIAEAPGCMLNAIGLQNPGVDYFIEEVYNRQVCIRVCPHHAKKAKFDHLELLRCV